jgi:hypothetical protein
LGIAVTEEVKQRQKNQDNLQKKQHRGMLGNFFAAIKFALIFGFMASLIINLYCWYEKGYAYTIAQKISQSVSLGTSAIAARNATLAAYCIASLQLIDSWGSELSSYSQKQIQQKTPKSTILAAFFKADHAKQKLWFSKIKIAWKHFWSIFLGTAIEIFIKFASVFLSFFIYIFALLLGAVDGLVQREIRRAEVGRESTFLFHKIADSILKIPGVILIVFLACPIEINPLVAIYTMAFLFFCFANILCANWKKNL